MKEKEKAPVYKTEAEKIEEWYEVLMAMEVKQQPQKEDKWKKSTQQQ